MRYSAFLAFSVLLVVIQTVVVPEMAGGFGLYDFMIPLTTYFSLYRPFREGFPIILINGIMMDMLSAAPIGIYLTVYLWLYVALRLTWRLIRVKQNLLFPTVTAIGVLFEHIVFWFFIAFGSNTPAISSTAIRVVGIQLFWAVATSPLMLAILHAFFQLADFLGSAKLQENGHS